MSRKLFSAIKKDHNEVRGIFESLLHANKAAAREDLLERLQMEIIPHMRAEERTLYPALREECRECKKDVLESYEEHHAARLILNELQEMSINDERFMAKAAVLREMVEHHIEEEEGDLFKDIKKNIGKDRAAEILEMFMQEKERVRNTIH